MSHALQKNVMFCGLVVSEIVDIVILFGSNSSDFLFKEEFKNKNCLP